MSFSRRYAKDNSKLKRKMDNKPSVLPEDITRPSYAEFKKRKQDARQARIKEDIKRRQPHASRLNNPKSVRETEPLRFKGLVWSLVLLVVLFLAGFAWHTHHKWFFPIKQIALLGNFNEVNSKALDGILQQTSAQSLLFVMPAKLQHEIEALDWVESANVLRVWPTTLKITIIQRQAVARFANDQLLDSQGNLFTAVDDKAFNNLPLIVGPANQASQLWTSYRGLNAMLSPIHLSIVRFEVSPRLSYTLMLSNGINLYLGSNNVVEHLSTFVKVYSKMLENRANQIDHVDMRYSSGMAVGWKETAVAAKPSDALLPRIAREKGE